MSSFSRYIGVDYSGAKTPNDSLTGLRVYTAKDDSPPVEIPPPLSHRTYWTRRGLAHSLVQWLSEGVPSLIGIDHGFSFPLQYFDKHGISRDWDRFLEDFCDHWPTDQDHLYVDFVRNGSRGNGAARTGNRRWRRLTEIRAGTAKSVFQFDVPGQVAHSTHARIPDGRSQDRGNGCASEDYVAETAGSRPQVTENRHLRNIIGSARYYRQHQRLHDSGIVVSRSSLNTWASRAIDLLVPVFEAQNQSVLQSRVLAMDETSIKAGRKSRGKMRTGWLWPVYGDRDEVVFHYAPSREHRHVRAFLGQFAGTLLSNGYEGYAAYARERAGQVIHAQCWGHSRRFFERAKDIEPEAVAEALALIGTMYRHERQIRKDALTGSAKHRYRNTHIRPVLEAFWKWCQERCERPELLPKSPLAKALHYVRERRDALEVFLNDPNVPLDTAERALRGIALGRKSWLFAGSDRGGERAAVMYTLIGTAKLNDVDPQAWLADVLDRIAEQSQTRLHELLPWH